jgi:hypothetical protein
MKTLEIIKTLKKIKKEDEILKNHFANIVICIAAFNLFIVTITNMFFVDKVYLTHIFLGLFYFMVATVLPSMLIGFISDKLNLKRIPKTIQKIPHRHGVYNDDLKKVVLLIELLPIDYRESIAKHLLYNAKSFKTDYDYIKLIIKHQLLSNANIYDIKDFKEITTLTSSLLSKKEYQDIFLMIFPPLIDNISKEDYFKNKKYIMDMINDFSLELQEKIVNEMSNKLSYFNEIDRKEKKLKKTIDKIVVSSSILPLKKGNKIFKIKNI